MQKLKKKELFKAFLYGFINWVSVSKFLMKKENLHYNSFMEYQYSMAVLFLKTHYNIKENKTLVLLNIIRRYELIISIILVIFRFLVYHIKFLITKPYSLKEKSVSINIGMTEQRFINLLKKTKIENIVMVDIPGQSSKKYKSIESVSVFSGIRYKQFVLSFIYSIELMMFMHKKYSKSCSFFRYYSSFDYFLAFYYLSNLDSSNSIFYTGISDRWVYIANSINLYTIWVQHGKIDLTFHYIRCNNINEAYYLNEEQREACERLSFDKNKPIAKYLKLFDFTKSDKMICNGKRDVLIICSTLFEDKQDKIISQIANNQINLLLKPHPMDDLVYYQKKESEYPSIIILSKFEYPKVDLIISYDSTLADEYEMKGIDVLRYNDENFESTIQSIFLDVTKS